MSISPEYIRKVVNNVLNFLHEKKITYSSDLDGIIGQTFLIDENEGESVSIELRPSNLNTTTYVLSYKSSKGIPLEIRLNEKLGYSKITMKGNFRLPEYEPFMVDPFGNTAQDKRFNSTDVSLVINELKKLAEK